MLNIDEMLGKIYCADCLEIMRQMPDKCVDLVLTDPPYGINAGKEKEHNGWKDYGFNTWDENRPNLEVFKHILRIGKNAIIWGGNYFADLLPATMGWMVWDKGQREFSLADGELAWTSFDIVLRKVNIPHSGFVNSDTNRIHPTQKPVALYDWIYHHYLPNGGRVIDTHLGSGSNRIAAHKAGNIDFTGFELDEDYYKAQEKRYKNFIAQLRMF